MRTLLLLTIAWIATACVSAAPPTPPVWHQVEANVLHFLDDTVRELQLG